MGLLKLLAFVSPFQNNIFIDKAIDESPEYNSIPALNVVLGTFGECRDERNFLFSS